jgi:hypothetical protein
MQFPGCTPRRDATWGRAARPCGAPVLAALAALLPALAATSRAAGAQPTIRTLTACTPGVPSALAVCTELRLTSGPAGASTAFELALRTIGGTGADAALPIAVYNLVLGTGASPDAGGGRSALVVPTSVGGATISDASAWDLFDAGDALFLSALSNRGVGGCATGADVDGFGQAARTCGAGQFVSFTFAPTALFDPARFTLLNLEAVALTSPLRAASCGAPGAACVITADALTPPGGGTAPGTTVPEPTTVLLLGTGLLGVAGVRRAVRLRATAGGARLGGQHTRES